MNPTKPAGTAAAVPNPFVVEVAGADAAQVVNNLCTNDIVKLESGACCESFITDVRGWVVAHCMAAKLPDRLLLLGSHPDPASVCQHIERYIIREDAQVSNLSPQWGLMVLDGPGALPCVLDDSAIAEGNNRRVFETLLGEVSVFAVPLPIFSRDTYGLCFQQTQRDQLLELLTRRGVEISAQEDQFHLRRIANLWPLSPQDIREKCLPQELDRDAWAISFTKGCYLGQETIARLDARGQLQKKLCLVEIETMEPIPVGEKMFDGEKEVGVLTSAATDDARGRTIGLAFLRRGSMEPGTQLVCHGCNAQVHRIDSKP